MNGAAVLVVMGEHRYRRRLRRANERWRQGSRAVRACFADGEVQSNDSSPLLGAYTFEIRGDDDSVLCHGFTPLRCANARLGRLSDELALVVDEERGILLRVVVVVGVEELSTSKWSRSSWMSLLPRTLPPVALTRLGGL